MERDEPVSAPASGGFEDDDEVDLSFAGPEPVAAAPWPMRLLDARLGLPAAAADGGAGARAPGGWCATRRASTTPREAAPPRHEPDYTMTRFVVQRFGSDGALRSADRRRAAAPLSPTTTRSRSTRRASAPSAPTASSRSRMPAGRSPTATAARCSCSATRTSSRPAHGKEEQIEFRGEFLHAFRNVERLRSHLPVVVTQGQSVVRADGMDYDNLARVVDLKGRTSATFTPPRRAAAPMSAAAAGLHHRRVERHRPGAGGALPARRLPPRAGRAARRRGRALGDGAGLRRRDAGRSTAPTCATSPRSPAPVAPASPRRALPDVVIANAGISVGMDTADARRPRGDARDLRDQQPRPGGDLPSLRRADARAAQRHAGRHRQRRRHPRPARATARTRRARRR